MRKTAGIFLISGTLLMSSCNFFCMEGEGPIENEKRDVGEFTSIELSFDALVTIQKGNPAIEIFAQKNVLPVILSEISSEKLKLKSDRCFETDEPVQIKVFMNNIEDLEISGSGTIKMLDSLMCDKVSLEINGSGNIECKLVATSITADIAGSGDIILVGSANKLDGHINGSGDVDAYRLPCNRADIEINGSGNFETYVLKTLTASINGSGDIRYKGTPKVKSEINGSGSVENSNK